MQRFLFLAILVLISFSASASVLLPDSSKPRPNLGLNPTIKDQKIIKNKEPAKVEKKENTAPILINEDFKQPKTVKKETYKQPAFTPRKIELKSTNEIKKDLIKNIDNYIPESIKKQLPANYKSFLTKQIKNLNLDEAKNISPLDFKKTKNEKINITPGGVIPKKKLSRKELLYEKYVKNRKLTPSQKRRKAEIDKLREKGERALAKRTAIKPVIIDEIPSVEMNDKKLKKQISVLSVSNYIWGENDIKRITRTLGYKRNDIPKYCQLKHVVTVNTDDTFYKDDLWGGSTTSIKYGGDITYFDFKSVAVCYPPKSLPSKGGIIVRLGDKYTIQLTGGSKCKPTKTYLNKVMTKYIGNGEVKCLFK